MYELIKLTQQTLNDESVNTVNARELHKFLGSKQDYSTWIKKRIEKYEFVENQDYIRFHKKMEANNATMVEYYVTLDMVENNEKGRQARRYFIECEKQLRTLVTHKERYFLDILRAEDDVDRVLAVRKLDQAIIKPLEQFKEQALPKVDFYDIAVASSSTVDIGEAAKILKYKATGRNNLFKFLRREGVLMKNNTPKQEYVNKGWFKLIEYKINGEVKIKTLVYQKGLDGIRKMLNEAGLLPEDR